MAGTIINLDGLTIQQETDARNKNRVGLESFNVMSDLDISSRADSAHVTFHIEVKIPDIDKARVEYDHYLHSGHGVLEGKMINSWNVTNVTDMSNLFNHNDIRDFGKGISQWNVSQVTNMSGMFAGVFQHSPPTAPQNNESLTLIEPNGFNKDISEWDVSKVTNMAGMFAYNINFNQNIGSWNVGAVENMSEMFKLTHAFDKNIGGWDVSQVTNMSGMFEGAASFNQDINNWNTGDVNDLSNMFKLITDSVSSTQFQTSFDKSLSNWDVSNVTNMNNMLNTGSANPYNHYLGWSFGDSPNITNFIGPNDQRLREKVFRFTPANKAQLVSGLKKYFGLNSDNNQFDIRIHGSSSNDVTKGYINNWDVSKVTDMSDLFKQETIGSHVTFNEDISNWDVSKVTNMSGMFANQFTFNQDISGWNVSNVNYMNSMFMNAYSFNQDISGWDVSKVTDMSSMFFGAKVFNQDISSWNVSKVTHMSSMFEGASAFNQPIGTWNVSEVTDMSSMFMGIKLIREATTMPNITVMVTTGNNSIDSIQIVNNVSGYIPGDKLTIRHPDVPHDGIIPFGPGEFSSFEYIFVEADFNLDGSLKINQNLNGVFPSTITSFPSAFSGSEIQLDYTNVTLADGIYNAFDQDISSWEREEETKQDGTVIAASTLAKVTNMESMFMFSMFDENITGWNVGKVTNMSSMFRNTPFQQAIYKWTLHTEPVILTDMFKGADNMIATYGHDQYQHFNETPNKLFFTHPYKPANKAELQQALKYFLDGGNNYNPTTYVYHIHGYVGGEVGLINNWDLSLVNDMSYLFNDADLQQFNYDIG